MGINLIAPGSASPTAALFYDTGAFGATAQMTEVAGVPVSAAVEIQSTKGALLLPRMTTAERLALTTVVDGMEVYDATVGAFFSRVGATWVQAAFSQGMQYATGTLNEGQIRGMFAAGQPILPAPGAGLRYLIHSFDLKAIFAVTFANGGNIYLQYGAVGNSGFGATFTIAPTLFAPLAANQSSSTPGANVNVPSANSNNAALTITNSAAAFTGGAGSSAAWKVWYSIVPV